MGQPTCPFCAEAIKPAASRCGACGERLDGGDAAPPPARSSAVLIVGVVAGLCVGGACLLALLATLLLPSLTRAKSKANRTKCANNLRMAGLAMIMYADDKRFYPHVRATRDLDGDVTTSDSPRIARALLWYGYLDQTDTFICPESYDLQVPSTALLAAPRTWFWDGGTIPAGGPSPFVDGQADPNLDQTGELSYGWTRRGLTANTRSTALLSADRALRDDPAASDPLGGNHPDGWNVGQADGQVSWVTPPGGALVSTDPVDRQAGFLSIEPPN